MQLAQFAQQIFSERRLFFLNQVLQDVPEYKDVIELHGPITKDLAYWVYDYVNQNAYTNKFTKNEDRLLVNITSNGGDPDAAYQIYKTLSKKCGNIDYSIPVRAKSAATLLALSGSKIYMTDTAELGPLDIQIETDSITISGNSITDSLKNIKNLHKKNKELSSEWLKQLNPIVFSELNRKNKIVIEYSKRMWKVPSKDKVIRKLTKNYPHHSYVLDIDEVRSLGFNVFNLESLPKLFVPLTESYKVSQAMEELNILMTEHNKNED